MRTISNQGIEEYLGSIVKVALNIVKMNVVMIQGARKLGQPPRVEHDGDHAAL